MDTPPEGIREDLMELYWRWFADVPPSAGRSEVLDKILADDWVYINYDAEERGKDEYLEYIKEVPPGSGPDRPDELQVRPFGDLVIVHGVYHAPGLEEGTDLRFSGAWRRTEEGWRCLMHHSTRVPK